MTDKELGTAAGDIFAKAFTIGYETGRKYVPPGGMALTAEQVEDVRTVLNKFGFNQVTPEVVQAIEASKRLTLALFPATEPAEAEGGTIINGLIDCQASYTLTVEEFADFLNVIWEGRGDYSSRDRLRKKFPTSEHDEARLQRKSADGDCFEVCEGHPVGMTMAHILHHEPESEPAEEVKPIGWYRAMTRKFATAHFGFPEVTGLFERTHTASDGGVWGYCGGEWELREYPPAPAEPAEEETKAEDESGWHWVQSAGGYYSGPACTGGYGCRSMAHYEGCLRPSLTASSPVVPAPTETGPWPTWESVPDGVVYQGTTQSGLRTLSSWVNDNGLRIVHKHGPAPEFGRWNDHEITAFAPFVAAEEG